MSTSILFTDTPEHFYGQLQSIIEQTIRQELASIKKETPEVIYIKKQDVCKLLQVSKPTVDSHVEKGYYRKHCIGSRVFFNKAEIMEFLQHSQKTNHSSF